MEDNDASSETLVSNPRLQIESRVHDRHVLTLSVRLVQLYVTAYDRDVLDDNSGFREHQRSRAPLSDLPQRGYGIE
jgi:hypothetical protein